MSDIIFAMIYTSWFISVFLSTWFPELKAESNRTECYLAQDNNSLLVYKVEPPSAAQSEDKVRMIAIERQGVTEVEVQVWKTVEGDSNKL